MTDRSAIRTRRWRTALLVALGTALVIAGCGGGDTTEDVAEPAPEPSTGEQMLMVTIGDTTYEADLSADFTVCISMGGAVGAAGPIPGIDGASIDVDIPPEDYETSADQGWSPPSVRVDLGEDKNGQPISWGASRDAADFSPDFSGKSRVDSFTVDGASVSGTATFIDFDQVGLFLGGQVGEPQPVQGTFAVNCRWHLVPELRVTVGGFTLDQPRRH